LNCYYKDVGSGAYAGKMSNIRVEGCYFDNVNNPTGLISTDGQAGVFVIDCNAGATQTDGFNTAFEPPYDYQKYPTSEVVERVTDPNCGAGPTLSSPTQCGCTSEPPIISITSPANNTLAESPATIEISAEASDTDGNIATVKFYVGDNLLGTDSYFPYSYTWNVFNSGEYVLTAVAIDNSGTSSTSAEVHIVINRGQNSPFIIQGENACEVETGAQLESSNEGFNGEGYVNLDNEIGTYARWNIRSEEEQEVNMIVRYAASSDRNMSVAVNGIAQAEVLEMPSSGSFTAWFESALQIALQNGDNSITFTSLVSDGGPNIDQITFESGTVFPTENCEQIIADTTTRVVTLVQGWNLIGCTSEGNETVENSLSTIWEHVEVVKDFNGFYSKNQASELNSLLEMVFGRAYFVYVTESCELSR